MKLRTRLTLGFLLLSLVSMAAVGFLAFKMGQEQILNNTLQRLDVTNELTEDEFSRWMTGGLSTLESIAQRPLVVDLSREISVRIDDNANEAADQLRDVHMQPRLQEAEFETLFLLDPDSGQILVSTNMEDEGLFREQEPFFQQGRMAGTIQAIYFSLTEQRPRMTAAVPIKTETGELVGVLAGHLNLEEMARIFSPPGSDRQTEETYLVNRQGMAISELLNQQDAVLETWILTSGVESCMRGDSILRESIDYRGAAVLGSYKWLPEYDLCLVTEIDQAEALEPIQQYRSSVIGFGLGAAAFFSLLGFIYTGTLAAPVIKMRDVARRYRRGELGARMAIPSTDEYAALAHEFNRMAAELQMDFDELERRYQSLFESVPVGLYQSTFDGEFREVNSTLAEILDFENREEMLATSAPVFFANTSDRDRWLEELKQKNEVVGFELEIKRKDGERIWLRHDAHLTQDSEGNTIIEGAVMDITARHRIAAELRASEARFRSVVQNSQDLISILDAEGNYIYISPSMKGIFGHEPEELLHTNAFALVHPEDVAEVEATFAELLGKPGSTLNA
ncbi:MAG: PAS domain S-box protein, partial [Anaerolineales bacterium]